MYGIRKRIYPERHTSIGNFCYGFLSLSCIAYPRLINKGPPESRSNLEKGGNPFFHILVLICEVFYRRRLCSLQHMDVSLPAHVLEYLWPYRDTALSKVRFLEQKHVGAGLPNATTNTLR